MSHLWRNLIRSDLPSDLLDSMEFAVFGLGDSGYERFNWAAKKLQRRLENLGAREILARGDADDQDYRAVEGALTPWIESLFNVLDDLYPGTREVEFIPSTELPPPRARLQITTKKSATGRLLEESQLEGVAVTLTKNSRITAEGWYQDVRHIEFKADHNLE
ncbi:NAPDH-dependent diflavin reductase [Tulasnella sp. 419]|nr:NAPDH-dependent diflavin reductase [Tulasnella sp. 419]